MADPKNFQGPSEHEGEEVLCHTIKGQQSFRIENGRRIWLEPPPYTFLRGYDNTPQLLDIRRRLSRHA